MEHINQKSDPTMGDARTTQARFEPPAGLLAKVQALYDQGLCRQAHALASASAPLADWRGVEGDILAGRILLNLGATRPAFRHHIRAFRAGPNQLRAQAYYLEVFLQLRGPVFAWQRFRGFENAARAAPTPPPANDGWEYLFSLGARICGHFRDFEQAEERIKVAGQQRSETPWLLVEKAGLLAMREQWEEAVVLLRSALAQRPWYRPAVGHLAQCLHTLDRDEEALALLHEAVNRIESLPLLSQLASLQMDLEKYADALGTLNLAAQFSPVLDQGYQRWLAGQQCRAHCALGNHGLAETAARLVPGEYHAALAERLHGLERPLRRVQLNVPFIQQFRMTCVPATLTMLRHFWKLEADHVELAEALCYDGTPSHRARRWAETHGMLAREFTLDWNLAVALLERGIPFAVFTAEATSAHVQVMAGYDELRRTFIIRNPSFPQIQEAEADWFLKHYAATGPAGMVLLPAGSEPLLSELTFPDAELYDQLRQVQEALEQHRRAEAETGRQRMQALAPEHWLTLTAGRVLHSYDTNLPALLAGFDQLLAQFPEDGNLLFARLGCLRETGRREERLEFLQKICARREADPVFRQQLAQEMMADARSHSAAELELKRVLRVQPMNAFAQTTLANLYWTQRRFVEALEAYRFITCVEDKKESAAQVYFGAATACRQAEAALVFLRRRSDQSLAKSAAPFITWFHALRQLGRATEARQHLEAALRLHPEHGELWLTAADAHARQSEFEAADQCLATAEGKVPPQALLKAKAELARYRADLKSAWSLWREVLQTEPLAMPVHRSLAWVMAESEGPNVAVEYLQTTCERFPHHYQLHQLWCEWARQAAPETGEHAVRTLAKIHPADAWVRRELALLLVGGARYEEALVEAEEGLRLAPHQAVGYTTRAYARAGLGQLAEAQADYREAIRLSVDHAPAIHGLVNSGGTLAERRESLAFVEQELVRQVVFGEGLEAYRDAARLNLEPAALLASLRLALRERPDLAVAWSVVVGQLAEMLQLDEALALARQAVERFPLLEQAWLDLALVQRLRLEVKGERDALEQAMRISPTSSMAPRMLAQHYERHGEMVRAGELFEDACRRAPLDAVSHGSLAVVLWRQGMQPAAIERLRHALKIQPGYVWGWQTLGQWTAATGQPKLAEELAKIMVLQRPGEIRSLLVLARILVGGQRREEGLQAVNQALKRFPRNAEAHELRAEILAALGRNEEADAACEPEILGQRLPVGLRACRARIESRRGNLVSAIARMKAVLQENPGYSGGWHNLADWHWQQKQYDEALAAATNIRRLDPLNPVPLGFRASLKIQRADRAGAKADLEMALKLDPEYEFAALNLFELQLTDGDTEAARQTLEYIRRYAGAEKAKACEIKWRTKFLQQAARQKQPGKNDGPQGEPAALDRSFEQFKELCLSRAAGAGNLDLAIEALLEAGQNKRVDQTLEAAMLVPDCNPGVGNWWMQRRIARGKWLLPSKISRLCPNSEAARNAVCRLIEALAKQKRLEGRIIVLVRLIDTFVKFVERQIRGLMLGWLAWRHREWLRADNNGWATMGYALVTLKRYRLTARWLQDWRSRKGLKMWMLFNLVLALRVRRQWSEAKALLEAAVKLPGQDHTFQRLRLLLALEWALEGRTHEASAHFRELDPEGASATVRLQYHYTHGLLAVQQADPAQKKRVFKTEFAVIRKSMAKHKASTFAVDYRRCLTRMARDAHQQWRLIYLWLGF
jgi:tetratricopeptide (TPR) repeat protein